MTPECSGKLSKDEVLDAFHQAGFNLSEPQLKHIMTRSLCGVTRARLMFC
jgi:hypothetical protein